MKPVTRCTSGKAKEEHNTWQPSHYASAHIQLWPALDNVCEVSGDSHSEDVNATL